jgi:NAD(P)-dependent dehydrogenase (short-subunit alcohol dehydrogenase family)
MNLGLEGQGALVVGASRGIGRAIARQLALEGADCVICARGERQLEETAVELARESGRRIVPVTVDTRDAASIRNMVAQAAGALGRLDLLVNCAARVLKGEPRETLANTEDAMVIEDYQEKFLGYLRCVREVVPHMEKQGGGRILNVSGSSARFGGFISAGARNAAIVNLGKTLALELASKRIFVNTVLPGVTRTEAFDEKMRLQAERRGIAVEAHIASVSERRTLGRVVTAEELAWTAVFLLSPRSIALNGETLAVTGGEGSTVHY